MPNISYTNQQKAQCVIWMAEGHGGTAIQRKFFTKYRIKAPSRRTINLWYQSYTDRGSHSHRGGNGRPTIGDDKQNQIEEMFQADPRRSLREVGAVVGVHHTTVWHFLRNKLKLYPYRLQIGQQLSETDKNNRVTFAQLCKERLQENPNFLKRIVFSDECIFSLKGAVNKHNCRIWGSQRPETVYESPQSSPTLMVWCAISENEVIGPYFFDDGSVTGDRYKRMLRYYLFPKLSNYPSDMIFQQDGAPPHYAIPVRQYLDHKLPNRWMGRGGPIPWPARSPDLTPCDFFLWGYLKDQVFRELPQNIPDLKTKIRHAVESITEETLQKVFKNIENRLSFVIRQNGGHFENLLN